ncbi:MAG: peptidoglycan editing factor PgeF [Chloroflexi bacterium]|nr:peptidoglycan editing factor PgeF [Chloroflexota bacterium]
MQRHENQGVVYYRSALLDDLRHGVFTRRGGVSAAPFHSLNLGGNVGDDPRAVRQNHLKMYEVLGVDDQRACTVWQVHSADVVIARRPVSGRRWLAHADALVTGDPDVPLSMRFADCTPILYYAPARQVIAMAHAGWRGTVQGVASAVVRVMRDSFGVQPSDIRAVIGPSIGPERYQVGEEVVEAVQRQFGTTEGLVRRSPTDGTAYLDLWSANRLDLEGAGVAEIEVAGLCTAEHTDEFFSHRAEKGRTGRFGAVLCL